MSTCALIGFREGVPCEEKEFKNSWGGAARIWTALFDRYVKTRESDNWMVNADKLWALQNRSDLADFERAALISTFDYAIVRQENFQRFAGDLRKFVGAYPAGDRVYHLEAWAGEIESWDVEAVGWVGTSVSGSLWSTYDEESDADTLYDLRTSEDHFEVYDLVDKVDVT